MIKRSKCKLCDNFAFSKGFCKNHIKNKTIKNRKTEKQTENYNLDSYFKYLIDNCRVSDNSGQSISNPSRTNIAHILPKRNHKSVSDNTNNYLYLTFKEHERFDYLLFSHRFELIEKEFEKMMPKLIERLNIILPICKETTPLKIQIEKWIQGLK